MTDIAALAFSIDSSQVQPAVASLNALNQSSAQTTQLVNQVVAATKAHQQALAQWRTEAQATNTTLQQTTTYLDQLLSRMDQARQKLGQVSSAFDDFSKAQAQVEALGKAYTGTSTSLQLYAQQAQTLGLNSQQTVQSLQRITEALSAQTEQGKAVRQVLQDYGVDLRNLSTTDADKALLRFTDQLKGFQDTAQKLRSVQLVLGSGIDPDTAAYLNNPGYVPIQTRVERARATQFTAQSDTALRNAAIIGRQTTQSDAEYQDLSSRFNVYGTLTDQQRALISQALGSQSAFATQGIGTQNGRLDLLRYLAANPNGAAATGASNSLYFDGAPSQFGQSGLGQYLRYLGSPVLDANQAEISARYEQESRGASLFDFSPSVNYYGNSLRNLFNAYTPLPAIQDTRSLEPKERYIQSANTASTLAGYGIPQFQRNLQIQQRIKELQDPLVLQQFQGAFGSQIGGQRYGNILDGLQNQQATVLQPGAQDLQSLAEQSYLLNTPLDQRAQASQFLAFAKENGWDTSQITNPADGGRSIPVSELLAGAPSGAASVWGQRYPSSDITQGFAKVQAATAANQTEQSTQDLQQRLDLQTKLQAVVSDGAGKMQEVTTYWQTYNQLLADVGPDQAKLRATQAITELQATQLTQGKELLQQLEDQNKQSAAAAAAIQAAPSDSASQGAAQLSNSLDFQVSNAGRQNSKLDLTRYRRELDTQEGNQAILSATSAQKSAEAELATQQRLLSIAGDRSAAQEKLNRDIQVEQSFVDAMAKAQVADGPFGHSAQDAVQAIIEKVKTLHDQIDAVNKTAVLVKGTVDINNQADLDKYLTTLPQTDRASVQQALPDLRGANIGGVGNAAIIANGAQSVGLNPIEALTFAQIESSMNPAARSGSNFGFYQLGPNEYRQYGGLPGMENDPTEQAYVGANAVQAETNITGRALGRPAQPWETYITHQQGVAGGPALLNADPNASAVGTIAPFYSNPDTATKAITGNGGTADMTVGQFLAMWRQRYGQAQQTAVGIAGSSTDPELAQAYQTFLKNPNDPSITSLPDDTLARFRAVANKQGAATSLASQGTLEQASLGISQTQAATAALTASPAAVIANANAQQVQQELRAKTLAPADVGARTTQLNQQQIEETTQSLAKQTQSMQLSTDDTLKLADAWTQGAGAVQKMQDAIQVEPFQRQIDALAQQTDTTGKLSKALDDARAKLSAFQDAQQKADDAKSHEQTAQTLAGLQNQDLSYKATIGQGFFATDQQEQQAQRDVQVQIYGQTHTTQDTEAYQAGLQQDALLKKQATDVSALRSGFEQMGSAVEDAFNNAIVNGGNMRTIMQGLAKDIEQISLKMAENVLFNGAGSSVGANGGGLLSLLGLGGTASAVAASGANGANSGGILGFLGSLFGAGSGAAAAGAGGSLAAADVAGLPELYSAGGVFSRGNPIPFSGGGIVDRPTFFSFASGSTGLMGEAGNEAILPLSRMANGQLGVATAGGGAGSGANIAVNTPITIQQQGSGSGGKMDAATQKALQQQVENTARMAVKNVLLEQQRQGGMLYGTATS